MDSPSLITLIIVGFTLLVVVAIFVSLRRRPSDSAVNLTLLQNQILGLQDQLRKSLEETRSGVEQRLNSINETVLQQLMGVQTSVKDGLVETGRTAKEVSERLVSLEQTNRQIYEVGKNISSLQEILRAPKLRGALGELFLGDLLAQILPKENYDLQYTFKGGQRVDAVIKIGGKLVPIDSKFSLESFVRMVEAVEDNEKRRFRKEFLTSIRARVDEIEKYIRPDEGTFDFALMYIPAENVYYETVINDEKYGDDGSVIYYALKKRVIPVSPNSFYAYLQAILLGLRGLKLEENAVEVLNNVSRLQSDLGKILAEYETLGSHIQNAHKKFDEVHRKVDKFSDRLDNVGQLELNRKNDQQLKD